MIPEILVHIGDMTVSFALLEWHLKVLTGSFICEHQRATQIITAELSFKQTLALASSLYLERHGKDGDYSTLRSLIGKATRIEDERNLITHSIWTAAEEPGEVGRVKTTAKIRKGYAFQFEKMNASDFKLIADRIKSLGDEVLHFYCHLVSQKKAINNPSAKFW